MTWDKGTRDSGSVLQCYICKCWRRKVKRTRYSDTWYNVCSRQWVSTLHKSSITQHFDYTDATWELSSNNFFHPKTIPTHQSLANIGPTGDTSKEKLYQQLGMEFKDWYLKIKTFSTLTWVKYLNPGQNNL